MKMRESMNTVKAVNLSTDDKENKSNNQIHYIIARLNINPQNSQSNMIFNSIACDVNKEPLEHLKKSESILIDNDFVSRKLILDDNPNAISENTQVKLYIIDNNIHLDINIAIFSKDKQKAIDLIKREFRTQLLAFEKQFNNLSTQVNQSLNHLAV
jgi:hypothetical protein